MEAVRPRPVARVEEEAHEQTLAPPPAPFPTDLLDGARDTFDTPQLNAQDTSITLASTSLGPLQQTCVQALSLLIPDSPISSSQPLPPLSQGDSQLAGALTELLEVSYELESLNPPSHHAGPSKMRVTEIESLEGIVKQMEDLQVAAQRRDVGTTLRQSNGSHNGSHPAVLAVREELAWARMDVLAHAIVELVSHRDDPPTNASTAAGDGIVHDEGQGPNGHQDLPPSYTQHDDDSEPPQYLHPYEAISPPTIDNKGDTAEPDDIEKAPQRSTPLNGTGREKLLRDFDEMSIAIERLQKSSPQLDQQRSELRDRERNRGEILQRMERDKMRELEEIWKLIERTHGRRRNADGTRVDMAEVEARRRERRRKWFEELMETTQAGRMSNQDAEGPLKGVDRDLAKASDLRERDLFLKELLEQGVGGRMVDQDAEMVEGESIVSGLNGAFIDGIIETTQNGRYRTQEYPESVESRLETKKKAFVESLVEYGSSGRFHDQDSMPPTPRRKEMSDDPSELVTMRDFFRNTESPTNGVEQNGHVSRDRSDLLAGQERNGDEAKKPGTLQKIAGLVRRSSLGLSLKMQQPDLSLVSYIAEHQENLLAVQVMLHGTGLPLKDDLYIETAKTIHPEHGVTTVTVLSKRDPSVSLHIDLPTPVTAFQSSYLQQQDVHLEAKLSALPSLSKGAISSLNTIVQHPLSASDLRQSKPKGLCCTACDREVADLAKANKSEQALEGSGFKDLPSEHWAEMLEVWMCHDDPAFTARLAQTTNEGFWPTRENVLVGGSYLLIHPDEVKNSSLAVEPVNNVERLLMADTTVLHRRHTLWVRRGNQIFFIIESRFELETTTTTTSLSPLPSLMSSNAASTDSWAVVKCLCGEVLGKKRDKQAKFGAGTLRFSKWAIALLLEQDEGEAVEPVRVPLSTFIMADLLELAQAHATYRFIISDEEENKTRLLMWIFNPSVNISYRVTNAGSPSPLRPSSSGNGRRSGSRRSSSVSSVSAFSTVKEMTKTLRAAKIMYAEVEDGQTIDVPGFGGAKQAGQVEVVTYPYDICSRLIDALHQSNAAYPVGRRKMGGLQVGFLERL